MSHPCRLRLSHPTNAANSRTPWRTRFDNRRSFGLSRNLHCSSASYIETSSMPSSSVPWTSTPWSPNRSSDQPPRMYSGPDTPSRRTRSKSRRGGGEETKSSRRAREHENVEHNADRFLDVSCSSLPAPGTLRSAELTPGRRTIVGPACLARRHFDPPPSISFCITSSRLKLAAF